MIQMSKSKGANNKKFNLKKLLSSRSLKYGTNSIILIAAVVAIAILLNLLVDRAGVIWDLTPNKIYSIGDTTKKILENLDKDVIIYGLFDETRLSSGQGTEFIELLNHYDKYPRVTVKYVDPDKNPGIFNEIDPNNVLSDSSKSIFIVKCGNKLKSLSYYDLFSTYTDSYTFQSRIVGSKAEQGFTGAIKYVTADVTPTIYFTTGHEEKDVEDYFSTLQETLMNNNFDVKNINLLIEDIPEDAQILVVASPKKDLNVAERSKLEDYLKDGGRAIFMFDYLETDPDFPEFEKLLNEFNVGLNYDKVKENDQSRHWPQNPYIVLTDVYGSGITSGSYSMIVANSRSINVLKNDKEYIQVTTVAKTSSQAVGEQVDKSRGSDITGPLNIAVAVEHKGWYKASKIAVLGNSLFLEDDLADVFGPYYSNGLVFFLDLVNWMYENKDPDVIATKVYTSQYININQKQANVMNMVVVIILPLIILGCGTYVFLRRRHL